MASMNEGLQYEGDVLKNRCLVTLVAPEVRQQSGFLLCCLCEVRRDD